MTKRAISVMLSRTFFTGLMASAGTVAIGTLGAAQRPHPSVCSASTVFRCSDCVTESCSTVQMFSLPLRRHVFSMDLTLTNGAGSHATQSIVSQDSCKTLTLANASVNSYSRISHALRVLSSTQTVANVK